MKKAILSFLVFGAVLSAAPVTASSVTLTGAGSPAVTQQIGNEDVYIGPYTLNIGGQSVAALCIDFQDNTNLNATWNANITNLSSHDLSKTYHPGSATQYKEAAYLFSLITKPGVSGEDRTELQDAAWYIFDSSEVSGVMNSESRYYYENAVKFGDSMNASNFAIVSSVDPIHNRQQEFMVDASSVPEPATVALMGAGLTIAGLVARSRRKRITS